MKKKLLLLFLSVAFYGTAQQLTLKKGIIIDAIPVNDTIPENFALYLPTSFDPSKKWPIVFVFDMKGRGKQVLSMLRQAAEEQEYVLAASNNINDSITLSKNILISSRMFSTVYSILPIKKNRSYTAGFSGGARLASLMPTFVKKIKGVISCGSAVANEAVLSSKNKFHFIGIVGNEDYNFLSMKNNQKVLDKLKFPNQLFVFDGGKKWPESSYLAKAMEIFTLSAMNSGIEPRNDAFISNTYKTNLGEVSALLTSGKALRADKRLTEMTGIYRNFKNVDSLKESTKTLRKTKLFRSNKRSQNATFFKENLIKDDYSYYLEEDVLSYNYNNLGWWKYQMEELDKYEKGSNLYEKQMGRRLKSFVNDLIADNIDIVKAPSAVDEEALLFLWMLNTITDAKNKSPYLKIISLSSKVEDYGTALFYLEELLKTGYTNTDELYALENTALFRITPEFNEIVAKYLKDARYETKDE
ncbi:alpha/beta hydrolase [Maribacter algarum]|uniref:Alpha/beta hydrolase n=1 Tax=Maribacter algarum (ex Zhang et al. 2020) TaxID=2578118 RepID=A0A5S3PG86_9FLAO|nr:alpha/beta hydrolase [Maribacter algarum]TMM53158.1 alpha/beta hydrolase [Maribacter algarum]